MKLGRKMNKKKLNIKMGNRGRKERREKKNGM